MSLASLHFQQVTDQWNLALAESEMNLIKFVNEYEAIREAKVARPGILFVGRHWILDTGRWFDMAANGQADAAMNEFIDMWIDSAVRNELDAFEGLNEEYDSNNDYKTYLSILLDRAFVRQLQNRAPQIKPVVMCAAVGNPAEPVNMSPETATAFLDLGAATQLAGGYFGYHTYWSVYNGQPFWDNSEVTRKLPMRWKIFDDHLSWHGIFVNWMFGEAGPCASDVSGFYLNPWDGWRHPSVYGADIQKVLSDIGKFDDLLYETKAYQHGRIAGYTLFTLNRNNDWEYFRYETPDMYAVCHYTRDNPSPDPTPPPPPPQYPVLIADISRHQGTINWPLFRQECEQRGVRGLIIRYTLGVDRVDDRFYEYWSSAKAERYWDLSVYHLFRPEYDGESQADHLLDSIEADGIELDFYPVFDAELDGGLSPEVISAKITGFYDRIFERTGWYPTQYTAAWWWNPYTLRGTGCNPDRCIRLHVANYTTAPSPLLPIDWLPDKWFKWQYTSSAVFQGVPQNTVDLSRFNGSVEDWIDFLYQYYDEPGPTPPCWGQPREQYSRVVWVVPPHIAPEQKISIYLMAAKMGVTCSPSYDDAGVGMLENKTAVLWEIPRDQWDLFRSWYGQYYPRAKVEFRYLNSPD